MQETKIGISGVFFFLLKQALYLLVIVVVLLLLANKSLTGICFLLKSVSER